MPDQLNAHKAILAEVMEEITKARFRFSPMKSGHEGYAILLEEVDELWTEIKAKEPDWIKTRKEAIQVAAMAICLVAEVC